MDYICYKNNISVDLSNINNNNNMELALEAEVYAPNRDDQGTYVDYIPSSWLLKNGIKCVCGSRKDQTFYTSSAFKKHLQCQKHKVWLKMKNIEPQNDIKMIFEHEKTIKNQQIIIHELEQKILILKNKIAILETPKHVPIFNLLDIDN